MEATLSPGNAGHALVTVLKKTTFSMVLRSKKPQLWQSKAGERTTTLAGMPCTCFGAALDMVSWRIVHSVYTVGG